MEARITLFNITRCGFYRRARQLNHEFGNLNDLLLDLKSWTQGKRLRATKTFEPADGSTIFPTYLFDIKTANDGSWLLTTWNETPTFEGAVASADGEGEVGNAEVALTEIRDGGIPGYPTYFYIIPDESIVASIRIHSFSTGLPGLRDYLKSFLELFSRHSHLQTTIENEIETLIPVGYSETQDSEIFLPSHINARFETKEIRNPGKLEYMRQHVNSVSKVTRKMTLDLNHHIKRKGYQRLLHGLGINRTPQPSDQKIKIKYEVQDRISLAELESMITDWESTQDRSYDDYGLVFRGGDGLPQWFSSSKASGEFNLNVISINDAILDLNSLHLALMHQREQILSLRV